MSCTDDTSSAHRGSALTDGLGQRNEGARNAWTQDCAKMKVGERMYVSSYLVADTFFSMREADDWFAVLGCRLSLAGSYGLLSVVKCKRLVTAPDTAQGNDNE